MKAIEILRKINACEEACKWIADKTLQEAWDTCHRGDWMLTYYSRKYPEKKRELTLAKGHCANTVRHLMTDKRSLAAVDAAIAYGNSECSDEDLKKAAAEAADAYSAASAAYSASYAAEAAYAASYAAEAAYAAASAAEAAYAAASAAEAAYAAASAAYSARLKNKLETANICREYLNL